MVSTGLAGIPLHEIHLLFKCSLNFVLTRFVFRLSFIQLLILLALILASLTVLVGATSYDKYDPGFGIYDDGFSNNDYTRYGPKYVVEHGAAYAARPPPKRIGVAYGRAPSHPPHYSRFY